MKRLIRHLCVAFILFFTISVKAQIIFNEDFNSYPSGHLISDYTSTTPGQGGWFCGVTGTPTASVIVTPESGRGNVVIITPNAGSSLAGITFNQPYGMIANLWKNRTSGYNICKFEYEFYGTGNFNASGNITSKGPTLINIAFQSNLNVITGNYWDTVFRNMVLKNYNGIAFPSNTWIKAEMYLDYNTKKIYFYIPSLNIFRSSYFLHNNIPEDVNLYAGDLNSNSVVKYDNIKITALQNLPSQFLSNYELQKSKFNLYPNPANNVVNISNSENLLIKQVKIYDLSGKLISTQSFNNETEIQLNVDDLASDNYMLHLQTNEGTIVKKLVKN